MGIPGGGTAQSAGWSFRTRLLSGRGFEKRRGFWYVKTVRGTGNHEKESKAKHGATPRGRSRALSGGTSGGQSGSTGGGCGTC